MVLAIHRFPTHLAEKLMHAYIFIVLLMNKQEMEQYDVFSYCLGFYLDVQTPMWRGPFVLFSSV